MKKFTKDPVEILMSKVLWFYNIAQKQSSINEKIKGLDEYEVLRNILSVLENNKEDVKPGLKLVK